MVYLTSLEMAKEFVLKSTENIQEETCTIIENVDVGMVSSLSHGVYFVPLDVLCQSLIVQGLPGMTKFNGSVDVVHKIFKTECIHGLYRCFGMTVVSYSLELAVWWGAYAFAQHMICRGLGY